jgi:hypothetical protein
MAGARHGLYPYLMGLPLSFSLEITTECSLIMRVIMEDRFLIKLSDMVSLVDDLPHFREDFCSSAPLEVRFIFAKRGDDL